ncbi:MAG: pilin [Candidatus Moranbacteria bacterium]|nr:pilin [Candidatus Moranbacteria bacterium]
MLTRKKIIEFLFVLTFCFVAGSLIANAQTGEYTPMEPIPGTSIEEQKTFPNYVKALYGFIIWTSGISAMFMITIGGFLYATAAGNSSRVEKAKGIIGDALLGLVAILTAWLILNVINPDLVNIDLSVPATSSETKK